MSDSATAIILAGGRSTRLGHDKAAGEFGGVSLLERTAGVMSTVCDEVIIAGRWRASRDWPAIAGTWVPDPDGAAGPLAGLRSGLAAARNDGCLAVACDMPFLSGPLLGYLLGLLGESDAVVPVIHGRAQPLHAAYSTSSLPTIDSLLRLGARSLHDLLSRLRVTYIGEQQCAEFDPAGLSTFNVNSPEDMAFAREEWARRTGDIAAA